SRRLDPRARESRYDTAVSSTRLTRAVIDRQAENACCKSTTYEADQPSLSADPVASTHLLSQQASGLLPRLGASASLRLSPVSCNEPKMLPVSEKQAGIGRQTAPGDSCRTR